MLMFLKTIEATTLFAWIRHSAYAYPVLLWLHLIALSMWAGLVLLPNIHAFGLGSREAHVEGPTVGSILAKRTSFVFATFFGLLLFGANASQYAYNPWFWVKILLLILMGASSLVFRSHSAHGTP